MANFTTQLKTIVASYAEKTDDIKYNEISSCITTALPFIFDFDFPIFDEDYKEPLERKIIEHYFFKEIGTETVGEFKFHLRTKLNEIMPYYNQLYESALLTFNPLISKNYTREFTETENDSHSTTTNNSATETPNVTDTITETPNTSVSYTNTQTNTLGSNETSMFSDTPQGSLSGVENGTYLTNATKNQKGGTDSFSTTGSQTNTGTNTRRTSHSGSNSTSITGSESFTTNDFNHYFESITGNDGVSSSKLLKEFRETFINIDMLVIEDLSDLFMNLWC